MVILMFQVVRRISYIKIEDSALFKIAELIAYAMFLNLFLLSAEAFKEYYSDTINLASLRYLYQGLDGHRVLVPWIWTALGFNVTAFFLFLVRRTRRFLPTLDLGCLLIIVGVWIEKGPGFVLPGFVPSPLGEIYDYIPNQVELFVSFGVWAVGLLIFTLFMKVAIPIERGDFVHTKYHRDEEAPPPIHP
jgi:molybdopterin-containing oxidoreductase family membrane subunit